MSQDDRAKLLMSPNATIWVFLQFSWLIHSWGSSDNGEVGGIMPILGCRELGHGVFLAFVEGHFLALLLIMKELANVKGV